MNWYIGVLKKYVEFNGRARRMEYWMFFLINVVVTIVIGMIEVALGSPGVLGGIYALAILLPALAVGVRRLHDTNRTGWWLLLLLIPFIGQIVILVFFVLEGDAGDNQYGPDPKAAAESS